MTIHERMIPRTEREKDLLKYGRSQERERIIKLLQERYAEALENAKTNDSIDIGRTEIYMAGGIAQAIALIKGENK